MKKYEVYRGVAIYRVNDRVGARLRVAFCTKGGPLYDTVGEVRKTIEEKQR